MQTLGQQHLFIVTGSSRGLGQALAQQLLRPDNIVLGMARHTSETLAQQAQLRGAHLEQWVQDLAEPLEAGQRLERWLHSLHAPALASATLINNAGTLPTPGPLQDCDPHELSRSLRVNLETPMQLCAAFLRVMHTWQASGWDGPCKVLNMSSGLGRRPSAGQAIYCAAKAGLDHYTRCTALDEARRPSGARIEALAPGVVDTDMQTAMRMSPLAAYPDASRHQALHAQGQLSTADTTAQLVLQRLSHPDFGESPVTDVRTSI
jgi:NAD(P)-dependent dehydrogenase (short-subunit alcohol dehydrogenase family)